MKILAASDLHNNKEVVKQLAKEAEDENVDLILLAGDLSVFGDLEPDMVGPFVATGKKVAFVSGNHDVVGTEEMLKEKYKTIDLQRHAFAYRDVGVFGAGGSNIGINISTDEETFENLSNGFKYIKSAGKKIMMTHMHPKGSMVEKFTFPGDGGVTKAIYRFKPDIHISGHIHEMEGFEEKMGDTKVLCIGSRGKIIEI